jgi:hypothetical protein
LPIFAPGARALTARSHDCPVLLKDLARQIGAHRSGFKRALENRGYSVFEVRASSSGNQKTLAISREDAERFRAEREAEIVHDVVARQASPDKGFVYAVEVDPEMRPGRIKVGWSMNIAQRLATYRAIAPDLRVVGLWRADGQFLEQTALLVARRDGTRIGQELFDNCEGLISALELMFLLLGIENVASIARGLDEARPRLEVVHPALEDEDAKR